MTRPTVIDIEHAIDQVTDVGDLSVSIEDWAGDRYSRVPLYLHARVVGVRLVIDPYSSVPEELADERTSRLAVATGLDDG
jgi:hypothetical protein